MEQQGPPFVRSDSNSDGEVDVSDAVDVLFYIFAGGSPPACLAAVNANGDLALDISDAIFILEFLFLEMREPPPPFPGCGKAQSADLPCAGFPPCR
jgi:hypothetical protein